MSPENVKVYELAKELGLNSITLLDKLKELNITVKSHMSALTDSDVTTVRGHFSKDTASGAEKPKKKVTRRKTASSTVKKRVAKKAEAAKKNGAVTRPTSAAATVIRRRGQTLETAESTTTHTDSTEEVLSASSATETQSGELNATATEKSSSTTAQTQAAEAKPEAVEDSSGLKFHSMLGSAGEGRKLSPKSIIKIVKEAPIVKRSAKAAVPKTQTDPSLAGQPTERGKKQPGRIISLGKEAIDKLIQQEESFKKKVGPAGKVDRAKTPQVKLNDYRAKKELIFLPRRKKIFSNRDSQKTEITTPAAHKRVIKVDGTITVAELANRLSQKTGAVMKKLVEMGVMANVNQGIDIDTATLIAPEFGYEVENVEFKEEQVLGSVADKAEEMLPRPPVVTVMGHVDHGKTSLLDALRSASVTEGESGGITQHIGAYTVDLDGKRITFIDTPGHEAFTMMRARGANVTDIVVLVVAADDGVMPQTREAVDHAKAAGVPIIVAVNKMDKPDANPQKVTQGLSELGIMPEDWGGENIFVQVSALQKTGLKELMENILLQAEMLELKANPKRPAEGVVLEARLEKGRGPVVSVLVKKGTLKIGDYVVASNNIGKVRALTSEDGTKLDTIGPSVAAELLGMEGVPTAGDPFHVVKSESEAREIEDHRKELARKGSTEVTPSGTKMTLEDLFAKVETGDLKELPVVLKSDVFGSGEAVRDSLEKLSNEKVKVKIIHISTGGITESDVMLASASNAIIVGFNVRPETKAIKSAERENVQVKTYTIIYELVDEIKKAMAGLLDKKAVEHYLGRAEVRETFSVPKLGVIAGSAVVDGKITRGCQIRLLRDSRVIHTGKIFSLKRFKDDAKEVKQGFECGIGIENYRDIKQGDVIEAFEIEMVSQEL